MLWAATANLSCSPWLWLPGSQAAREGRFRPPCLN